MKKSVDILNLPVISITEGKELGVVKDFVVNATSGKVAALIVDDGKWYLGAKLLPFETISGVGEYAITVESSNNILSVTSAPELEKLLVDEVKVIGTKVLTKTGRIQGTVTEIVLDQNGKIAACEVTETSGEISNIATQRIVTFGKEVLIITDDGLIEDPIALATAVESIERPNNQISERQTEQKATQEGVISTSSETSADDSAKKFDEKHRKFLLGKKASRRIETDNGMIIVEQGGEITEEVLQKAKLAGKFVELSMNIQ